MTVHRALAPAKVNLGLFLGPVRPSDARHELVTVMQSISLADELTLGPAPAGVERDEVVCPGVAGPAEENIAAAALRVFRAASGWSAPPQRLSIVKRIPVAGGMAGGSADAAAALRLARQASGLGDERLLLELAAELGADVPAQISPGRWLARGAGELLRALPAPRRPLGVLVLPLRGELSTSEVYREADRLVPARSARELDRLAGGLSAALEHGDPLPAEGELLGNDLEAAASSLCPAIAGALEEARSAGGEPALLSGSGPTVLGLFAAGPGPGPDGPELAARAAERLRERVPAVLVAAAVDAAFGAVVSGARPDER